MDTIPEEHLYGIYKTLLLFLEKLNFQETCASLKKDANFDGDHLNTVVCRTVTLKANDNNDVELILNDGPPEYSPFDGLKNKFYQLQDEHKKLMGVATELTSALHTNMVGQTYQINKMLDSCKQIYPDLFVNCRKHSLASMVTEKFSSHDDEEKTDIEGDKEEIPDSPKKCDDSPVSIVNEEKENKVEKASSAKINVEEIMDIILESAVKTPEVIDSVLNNKNDQKPVSSPEDAISDLPTSMEEKSFKVLSYPTSVEDNQVCETADNKGSYEAKEKKLTNRNGTKLFEKPLLNRSTISTMPFCYMELCTKLVGGTSNCQCSKCRGGSRYSCGCYEIIRRDLEEDIVPKKGAKIKLSHNGGIKNDNTKSYSYGNYRYAGHKNSKEESCTAFDPRPKIKRTPP